MCPLSILALKWGACTEVRHSIQAWSGLGVWKLSWFALCENDNSGHFPSKNTSEGIPTIAIFPKIGRCLFHPIPLSSSDRVLKKKKHYFLKILNSKNWEQFLTCHKRIKSAGLLSGWFQIAWRFYFTIRLLQLHM